MSSTNLATPFFAGCLFTLVATCPADESPARVPIASRSLASVSFKRETGTLEVEFRSGAIYRYRNVPEATYTDLLRAPSKGRYFSTCIRGKHAFDRVRSARP